MKIATVMFPSTLRDYSPCPICRSEGQSDLAPGLYAFRCRLCGDFFASRGDFEIGRLIEIELRPFVGAATRQASEAGKHIVLGSDYRELAAPHQLTTYRERMRKLLGHIGEKCRRPGQETSIFLSLDYTVADAEDPDEFAAYETALFNGDLIEHDWQGSGPNPHYKCRPTFKGWDTLTPSRVIGSIPGRCFVAQSFHPEMKSAYHEAIRPAILEAGYDPKSLLEFVPNDGITDRILAEVRLAEFVIAEFTHHRNGVYFEAGFARGLGRPVIGSCKRSEFEKAHFDIKHLGHVLWDNHEELRKGLLDSIRANIVRSS